jgi:hypothetical protein
MEDNKMKSPPLWLFAFISIGALLASGIYIGIMSVKGLMGVQLASALVYGLIGLLMFWMAYNRR